MGKISPVSAKYIVNANIDIEGVVDRPDVIGAIFGQTEGLLGADLELRELQRSGRIGRIEVASETKAGKTSGKIIIPSSLDKAETAIVAASLEIIQRIGPCNAKVRVENIEDVRISKRNFVVERAKELLKQLTEAVLPDSQELTDEVTYSVRVMEIQEYGNDRLPAGPAIDESDEVVVVEGRADVLNLLKHGFKNCIAMNGTSVPQTVIELSKKKAITAFVDGDRGGDLIIREIMNVGEVDFVSRAPEGKEVEELTKKEIHKALRAKVSAEQVKLELTKDVERIERKPFIRPMPQGQRPFQQRFPRRFELNEKEKTTFKEMLENLIGTKGAHVLDQNLNILGRIPLSEIEATMKGLTNGIYAVVFDGEIDREIVRAAEHANVKYLVAMDTKVRPNETRINLVTVNELG